MLTYTKVYGIENGRLNLHLKLCWEKNKNDLKCQCKRKFDCRELRKMMTKTCVCVCVEGGGSSKRKTKNFSFNANLIMYWFIVDKMPQGIRNKIKITHQKKRDEVLKKPQKKGLKAKSNETFTKIILTLY